MNDQKMLPMTFKSLSDNKTHAHIVKGQAQKKGISPPVVSQLQELKYVNNVSCVDHLSSVKHVPNVQTVVLDLPVRARLHQFWETWEALGACPKVFKILKKGCSLTFSTQRNLKRAPTVIGCYVNPHRNLYLLEALHQLLNKNAVELVKKQKSGVFQPTNQFTGGDLS